MRRVLRDALIHLRNFIRFWKLFKSELSELLGTGLEPARLTARASKTRVSANSTTRAEVYSVANNQLSGNTFSHTDIRDFTAAKPRDASRTNPTFGGGN